MFLFSSICFFAFILKVSYDHNDLILSGILFHMCIPIGENEFANLCSLMNGSLNKLLSLAGLEKILSLLVMNSISSGQICMLFVIIGIKNTIDLRIFSILPEDL